VTAEAFQDPDEIDRVEDFLATVGEVEGLTGIDFGDSVRAGDIRKGSGLHPVTGPDDLSRAGGAGDDLAAISGIGPNLFHQNQTNSWLSSMPHS